MILRDQHRRRFHLVGDVQRVLVEAEQDSRRLPCRRATAHRDRRNRRSPCSPSPSAPGPPLPDAERACRAGSRDRSRWRPCANNPRRASRIASTDMAEASTISAKIWMSYLVMSDALRGAAEIAGNVLELVRPAHEGHAVMRSLRRSRSARQRPGSMILSASTGFVQAPRDDLLGHQRRDLHPDIEHLPGEVRLHAFEHGLEPRPREVSGEEEDAFSHL